MKWIIFLSILILVLFSGCLDLISTRQKQLCLSATHESQTTIFECSKTSECYKKVNSVDILLSENLNYNLKNQMLVYKNNISSAIFYFNNSKKNIEKINSICDGQKDVDIIGNINQLFFNLSKVFEYQDKSWQKSVELLKDYAIYLKDNGVEEITEEEIYDSYVLINQNLNELRSEENLTDNYIALLKIEAKNANELAKKFGFRQSYMAEYGFVDLFAYYNEYVENPKKEVKLPVISKSSNHVFSRLSTIENFLKINEGLQEADNYNLYILFDKEFGMQDSLFTKFVNLNNEINLDIDLIYSNIVEFEEKIEEDKNYVSEEDYKLYQEYKYKFKNQEMGFGFYLAKIKEIYSLMIETKWVCESDENETKERLEYCKVIIDEAKKYSNNYFLDLIEKYDLENNLIKKEEYCGILKNALSNTDCLKDYKLLIDLKIIDDSENITDFDCIEKLNQLNYILENNEQIKLFKKKIVETEDIVFELQKNELSFGEEIEILNYIDKITTFKILQNYEIFKEMSDNLKALEKINAALKELHKNKIKNAIEFNYEIIYENLNYYLVLENDSFELNQFCFNFDKEVLSLDEKLKINRGVACVDALMNGLQKFKIEYKNEKTINTRLIELDLEKGLFETVVKNTVSGINDSLNLGQVSLVDLTKYLIDNKNNITYVTEKENKILYYKTVFLKTPINLNVESITNELLYTEKFKLKNKEAQAFCNNAIIIYDCYDCVAVVKENNQIKTTVVENGNLKTKLCFGDYEEKLIEIITVLNYSKVEEDIDYLNYRINMLNNCEVEEIIKLIKPKINEINKYLNKTLNFEEITKFYNLKKEVEEIEKRYNLSVEKIETINLIISRLSELELIEKEEKQMSAIEENKYKNIDDTLAAITKLYADVLKRIENEKSIYSIDFKNKITGLIDLGKSFGVMDTETISALNSLSFSESGVNEFEKIKINIDGKIIDKSKEIKGRIEYYKDLDVKEITEIVNQVNYLYSEITLKELYDLKYYPPITLQDAERLNKKKDYLETVSLMQNISKFEDSFNENNYTQALKYLDSVTMERLNDLNKEYSFVKNGLAKIKTDANTEIYNLSNTKNKDEINRLNADFENKKYLLVIKKSRELKQIKKIAPKINYQVLVFSCILLIFSFAYLKYNKKNKKITKEEKKQKILRQY